MLAVPFIKLIDFLVTLLLWVYFIIGFHLIFAPQLFVNFVLGRTSESDYQVVFSRFFSWFFSLIKILVPWVSIEIDPRIRTIRSSFVVCNHLSYLDPLLLISIFKKNRTTVKNTFFSVPIFGAYVKRIGFLPASANGEQLPIVIRQVNGLENFLDTGGVFFIFPEGTRSRDGKLGTFNQGAFKLAKRNSTPIRVLFIQNTDKLFKPGKFLFSTGHQNSIKLELLGTIDPDDPEFAGLPQKMGEAARSMIEDRMKLNETVNYPN